MTEVLIKIGAALALLVALFFAEQYVESMGYDRAWAEASVAIKQKEADAAAQLNRETEKTRAAEQALQAKTNQQENEDATHQKTVEDLSNRLRTLAGPSVRLRDPHAARCGPSGGGAQSDIAGAASDRPADASEAGGLLSADLAGLLQRLQLEADTINVAYASCRADTYAVRGIH